MFAPQQSIFDGACGGFFHWRKVVSGSLSISVVLDSSITFIALRLDGSIDVWLKHGKTVRSFIAV